MRSAGNYLMHLADAHLPANLQPRSSDAISDRCILLTMTEMLCNVRTDFANVRRYEEIVFSNAPLGSRSCFRNRHCDNVWTSLPCACAALFAKPQYCPLKQRSFGSVEVGADKLVPVDIDVSPLDNSGSNKEEFPMPIKSTTDLRRSSPTSGLKATCSITNCAQANSNARKASPRSFAHVSSNSTPSSSTERACFV